MASRTTEAGDLRERLGRCFERWREPAAAELCDLLPDVLGGELSPDATIRFERLVAEVYRLVIGGKPGRSLVVKLLKPAIAQTDRLVAERWLPALGLGDGCPGLLGAAAQRDGRWVWHVYEDLGTESLAVRHEPERLAAAVDLIAELHTRAATHPLLPEVRWRARDHGAHFLTSSVRDAISGLDALATCGREVPERFHASRTRLRDRLERLLEDVPRRLRVMTELGGPDTLLHGDLWPKNVFVSTDGGRPRARLIDWDHVGAGPFSYDLSTLLYRSAVHERPWIMQRYREAMERAGFRLPGPEALNLLFHTAESARCAHSVLFDAMTVIDEGAGWAIEQLMDYDRWLEALRPPLPD